MSGRLGSVAATVVVATLAAAAAVPAPAQQVPAVALETLATDVGELSSVTHVGDDRLFLTTLDGRMLVWRDGVVRDRPFLDLRALVRSGGEQGLFSVAFHPLYPIVSFLFVNYIDHGGDTVVARYLADGEVVRPRTRRVVLQVDQPFENHNGGQLQFGPDGFLYVGLGDGGSADDPHCFAQRGDTLLGKMLRIDVDLYRRRGPMYGIPRSNPFAGGGAYLPEVWAIGLRNPWRFSFDRATGDLFIADVGQGTREEIDLQPGGTPGGENYGWAREEGAVCRNEVDACDSVPPCGAEELVRPILEYDQGNGSCAVIGGYVYRGTAIPELSGTYLFGDFCSGTVWAARRGEHGGYRAVELGVTVDELTSFGEDAQGEIYLVSRSGVLALLIPG